MKKIFIINLLLLLLLISCGGGSKKNEAADGTVTLRFATWDSGEALNIQKEIAKQLEIDWENMTHEESNRVMLALLEDSFNLIRDIEDSKSIILQTKIVIKK